MGSRLGEEPTDATLWVARRSVGLDQRIFVPAATAMWEALRRITDCSSKRFSSDFELVSLARSPRGLAIGKIVYQRFNRWSKSGVLERIFKLLASDHDNEYMMIDATIVRTHQHSAGARKKTANKRSADPAAD